MNIFEIWVAGIARFSLIRDVSQDLPERSKHKMGDIKLGQFNSQYRETMIICDENWVWWTPHLNPARGKDRPTFVAEGENSKFVRLCINHFEAVKRMCNIKNLVV